MENLMNVLAPNSNEQKMSSRDMAQFTGTLHKNVLRKIKTIIDQIEDKDFNRLNFEPRDFKDERGKVYEEILMTKDASLFIASRYDINLHLAVQKRWKELEEAKQFEIPQTFSEALYLAAEIQGKLQLAEAKIEVDKPKVEAFDELMNRDGLYSFRDVVKLLDLKERKFINWLIAKDFIYRDQKGKLYPRAIPKTEGKFQVKLTSGGFEQTMITTKGLEYFREVFSVMRAKMKEDQKMLKE